MTPSRNTIDGRHTHTPKNLCNSHTGIQTPYESSLKGIYEYGHVRSVWNVLEKNGILKSLKKIFPDEWKVLFAFAMNRLIDLSD